MKTISKILSVVLCLAMVVGFFTFGASAATDHVVINQVYGGGGNNGAEYKCDFVELYNPTDSAISLAGYTLQYTSTSGVFGENIFTFANNATIAAGGFYLVQMKQGNGGTKDLPTPDATCNIAMSASNLKIALVKNEDAITGSSDPDVVDFVGAGTANDNEGGSGNAATAGNNTTAIVRKTDGVDTDNNKADFKTAAPNPRNSGGASGGNTGSGNEGGNTGSGNEGGNTTTPSTIGAVRAEATADKSYTVTGVITYIKADNKTVYIQDSTGAICLYFSAAQTGLEQGKVITAMGTYTEYKGLPELTGMSSYTTVTDSSLTLASVIKEITLSQLGDNICAYVKLSNLSVVVDGDKTYLSDGTKQVQWYTPIAATTPANGDTVTEFKGAVGCYNDPQLLNTVATEVSLTPATGNDNNDNNNDNNDDSNTGSDNDDSAATEYVKVTNGVLTSGKYVLVATNGYAPTTLNDKNWVLSVQPTVSGNKVTDAKGAVVTLTVSGNTVKITDANGKTFFSNGDGAKMGEKDTAWNWAFADGIFTFGTEPNDEGSIRYLSSNSGSEFKFRAYYPATEPDQWGNAYTHTFNVYKLAGSSSDNTGSSGDNKDEGKEEDKKPAAPVIDHGVKNPVADTAYKFGIYQENLKKYLYFAGTLDSRGYYLATTENYAEAVDVFVEAATNGYYMYFMNGTVKTYIDIFVTENDYVNLRLVTEPSAVYTWNAEHRTFTTKLTVKGEVLDYYVGTYNEYETLSGSKLSYISTSFPTHMYIEEPAPTGDNTVVSVAIAALIVSAMGATALVMKKKEF